MRSRMVDDYRPGDICITNDPYSGFVCTHTPDLHMWKPIFREDELVAFSVSHIHNTDVGGAVPASLSRATDRGSPGRHPHPAQQALRRRAS